MNLTQGEGKKPRSQKKRRRKRKKIEEMIYYSTKGSEFLLRTLFPLCKKTKKPTLRAAAVAGGKHASQRAAEYFDRKEKMNPECTELAGPGWKRSHCLGATYCHKHRVCHDHPGRQHHFVSCHLQIPEPARRRGMLTLFSCPSILLVPLTLL